jgi:DNA polymerase
MDQRVVRPTRSDPTFELARSSSRMLVPGAGNILAPVAVVGEGPGSTEDLSGLPFSGPSGHYLDILLAEAGFVRDEVWVTNLIKYRCTDSRGMDRRPSFEECRAGRRYLARELDIVSPLLVILCGRSAYHAVHPGGSVVKDRGTTLTMNAGRTYLVTLHPAAVLRGPSEWDVLTRTDYRMVPELLTTTLPRK